CVLCKISWHEKAVGFTSSTAECLNFRKINETELKAKQVQKEDLRAALDLFKLDNGHYPSTEEGLEALVTKPYGYSHWNGPYIRNLTAESIDDFVYENNGGFSNIVLSIKTN
ncbi:MAG: type II secretion system protein GspG, partial [Gammaproteobacteria bacterium]